MLCLVYADSVVFSNQLNEVHMNHNMVTQFMSKSVHIVMQVRVLKSTRYCIVLDLGTEKVC